MVMIVPWVDRRYRYLTPIGSITRIPTSMRVVAGIVTVIGITIMGRLWTMPTSAMGVMARINVVMGIRVLWVGAMATSSMGVMSRVSSVMTSIMAMIWISCIRISYYG